MIKHDSGEVPRTNTQQLGLDPRIFHNDKYTNLIHIDIRWCRLWLRFGFRVRPPSTAPIFFLAIQVVGRSSYSQQIAAVHLPCGGK